MTKKIENAFADADNFFEQINTGDFLLKSKPKWPVFKNKEITCAQMLTNDACVCRLPFSSLSWGRSLY